MDAVRRAGCTWRHRAVRIRPHDGGLDVTTRTAPADYAIRTVSRWAVDAEDPGLGLSWGEHAAWSLAAGGR
ncbi:hypothetical protein [Streptomyces phaeochromogenes]